MARWAILVGSGCYVGFSPVAPGTVASALAAALYYLLPRLQSNAVLAVAVSAVLAAGWWATVEIAKTSAERDPAFLVYDEIAGQWIALLTPLYQGNRLYVLVAFGFFRLFDILKPFPASYFQQKHGPVFVFMDDVVAAVYAGLAAHFLVYCVDRFY